MVEVHFVKQETTVRDTTSAEAGCIGHVLNGIIVCSSTPEHVMTCLPTQPSAILVSECLAP